MRIPVYRGRTAPDSRGDAMDIAAWTEAEGSLVEITDQSGQMISVRLGPVLDSLIVHLAAARSTVPPFKAQGLPELSVQDLNALAYVIGVAVQDRGAHIGGVRDAIVAQAQLAFQRICPHQAAYQREGHCEMCGAELGGS